MKLCKSKTRAEIRSQKYFSSNRLIPQGFGVFCICSHLLCLCLSKIFQINLSSPVGRGPLDLPEFRAPPTPDPAQKLFLSLCLSKTPEFKDSPSVSHSWKHPPPTTPLPWFLVQGHVWIYYRIYASWFLSGDSLLWLWLNFTSPLSTYSKTQPLQPSLSSLFMKQWWFLSYTVCVR